MKYFVTGATGFIGGRVAQQLADAGHQVVALARSPEKAKALARPGIVVHLGDITDKESMRAGMRGVDGVFHIAAWYKIGARDKRVAEQINVQGTRNVLELMRELNILKGVYTSTLAVFSDTHGQVVDEGYYHGGPWLSEYDRTKWAAHYKVALPMIRAGLPLVIVQPGLVYGPGDAGVSGEALAQYLQRQLPLLPKRTAYCWGHVDDTARGHVQAMERGATGASYIIAGPVWTFVDAMRLAEQITGVPAPRLQASPAMLHAAAAMMGVVGAVLPLPGMFSAERLRVTAGVTYTGSSAKAQRELGFYARPLEEGLKETLDYEMRRLGMRPKA
jgi:nucleoside-diphosphate-sugar epimerase